MVTRTKADLGALVCLASAVGWGTVALLGSVNRGSSRGRDPPPACRLPAIPTVLELPRRHFSFFLFSLKKNIYRLGMVVYMLNPCVWEEEAGRSL